MDEVASKRLFEESIKRVKRIAKHLGVSENDIVVEGTDVYVPISSSKHNRRFLLREDTYKK